MIDNAELRRVRLGPTFSERLNGLALVQFAVNCRGNAEAVLRKAKQVMEVVLRFDSTNWPSLSDWQKELPDWFVAECSAEMSKEQAERWLRWWKQLTPAEQSKTEREASWSMADWIYWMQPDERSWSWWNSVVQSTYLIRIEVAVPEWPFPWGALRWLFRAAGGSDIEPQ